MTVLGVLEVLARLAEIAFVGRVILSLLPPGLPGRHGLRDLAATWGASHVLGTVALALEFRGASLLGLELPPLAFVAPWFLVAFARWITLPGAMVPRHEPIGEAPGALARVLTLAAPLAVVAAAGFGGAALLGTGRTVAANAVVSADAIALLACCSFALAAARRAPLGRALVVLALAAILAAAVYSSEVRAFPAALGTGAGAAFGVVWVRRGDRRAAILAVIAFAGCGILGLREMLLGAAGLFALWVHTPEPAKRSILLPALLALAVCAASSWSSFPTDPSAMPVFTSMTTAVLFVVALAVLKRKRLADARLRDEEVERVAVGRIESTRVERDAVRDAVILSLFPMAARGDLSSFEHLAPTLLPLLPMVLLELGLLLAPVEHPSGTAATERETVR